MEKVIAKVQLVFPVETYRDETQMGIVRISKGVGALVWIGHSPAQGGVPVTVVQPLGDGFEALFESKTVGHIYGANSEGEVIREVLRACQSLGVGTLLKHSGCFPDMPGIVYKILNKGEHVKVVL